MPTYTDHYLERYREKIRRRATEEPAKPAKDPLAGFAGEGVAHPAEIPAAHSEGATPFVGFVGEGVACPQNFADEPSGVTRKTRKTPWRLADIPPERQAEEARRRLDTLGWCAILARKIGDDAVLILCEDPARVPASLAREYPVFTLAEAKALAQAGIEAARTAYAVKLEVVS